MRKIYVQKYYSSAKIGIIQVGYHSTSQAPFKIPKAFKKTANHAESKNLSNSDVM